DGHDLSARSNRQMGSAMSVGVPTTPPPGTGPDASIARLHGEACWWCGAVNPSLRPIGEVTTAVEGGRRVWTVVGCKAHQDRELTGADPASQAMRSPQLPSNNRQPAHVDHTSGVAVSSVPPPCHASCSSCGGDR
ncbi:hypothetical protein AB0M29_45095, partial [Streptomyces sp. NPDC051976]|uniref:hypothetical protein n=1 Tax=Streptomyces sp. NPDC051976 TaxID=3154947 RepID=UPI0034344A00